MAPLPCFGGKQKNHKVESRRRLRANDRPFNDQYQYAANFIKTYKYNVISFVPKNLFEQFQRLANFYFLVLMILQLIPEISPLTPLTTILPLIAVLSVTATKDAVDDIFSVPATPWYTTAVPLGFVLLISGVKDLIDDIQRHRCDNMVNNRKAFIVHSSGLKDDIWQNVKVGDIIRMESDQFVAADLLLLSSSEPHGLCYIETAELDGETNLKARQAIPDTAMLGDNMPNMSQFNGEIDCEPPNNRLNSYEGVLKWNDNTYSLDNEKMLLRGTILRNTRWCYGLVIFAGKDTKLMMNSGKTTFKRTSLDRFLNVLIIGIVMFLLSMCLICTVLCGVWEWTTGEQFVYLPWASFADDIASGNQQKYSGIAVIAFLMFFSYAILLNTVVPISLYVSVEIIRFCHSWWINWDLKMYHDVTDTPARSRTTTLNEELGQVQYIFTDKTGTLTQNIMAFNKCTVDGKVYGELTDGTGQTIEPDSSSKSLDFSWNKWAEKKFTFYDESLLIDTRRNLPKVSMFWRLIALCHTVMPEYKDGNLVYQAQSPDEAALTSAARNFGYVFKERTPKSITIEVDEQEESYELLGILDFNNVRKRMSVIVRGSDGRITLLCKGADTVVLELIDNKPGTTIKKATQQHLDKFAGEGLRTLCCAYKDIDEEYFRQWTERHHAASIALEDRQEKLDEIFGEIEQGMSLIGATAIEDKLQDGVPDTIANLLAANIKIWVLTGDKQETAINIGYSCRLLTELMHDVYVIDGDRIEQVTIQLRDVRRKIERVESGSNANSPPGPSSPTIEGENNSEVVFQHTNGAHNAPSDDGLEGFALVINGHALHHALSPQLEAEFLEVGCKCAAVICCRVTPLQKAMVVDLVKRNKKAVTLSIGDGANDVSMIKTAHIGVGISGQEGMQAVLSSDFSIGQFRFLERLLLVHGRWSYFRMSKFLRYFFYKNFAFTLAHFWYAFYCGYSATTVYDPAFIACYNLFFTSMPVIALGVFDQDVNDAYSLRFPKLYIPGQFNVFFNMRIFIYSVLHGMLSSLALFFIPYYTLKADVSADGLDVNDYSMLAFTVFSALVVSVTAQVAFDTAYWTVFNHIVIWGSLLVYFALVLIFYELVPYWIVARTASSAHHSIALKAMATSHFWLSILLCVVALLLPVLAMRFWWFDTRPSLSDRLRVRQNLPRLQRRGMSELPLRVMKRTTTKRRSRRGSLRSGYAFSHQQGFGELITRGQLWREVFHNMGEEARRTSTIFKTAVLPALARLPEHRRERGDTDIDDELNLSVGGGARPTTTIEEEPQTHLDPIYAN